jgi:hypothetical protein
VARGHTIEAISPELGRNDFVSRYSTAETDDGLAGDEGQFLTCSFWLLSALALNGRVKDARAARAISAAQVDAVALSEAEAEAETVAVAAAGTRMAADSVPEVKAGLGARERARNPVSRHVEPASFRLRGVRCGP